MTASNESKLMKNETSKKLLSPFIAYHHHNSENASRIACKWSLIDHLPIMVADKLNKSGLMLNSETWRCEVIIRNCFWEIFALSFKMCCFLIVEGMGIDT